jgi:hypothetical protein
VHVRHALHDAADGSFLHTQGQDMPWFQVLMLDVLALYAAVAALACAVLGFSCRRLLMARVGPRFGRRSGYRASADYTYGSTVPGRHKRE